MGVGSDRAFNGQFNALLQTRHHFQNSRSGLTFKAKKAHRNKISCPSLFNPLRWDAPLPPATPPIQYSESLRSYFFFQSSAKLKTVNIGIVVPFFKKIKQCRMNSKPVKLDFFPEAGRKKRVSNLSAPALDPTGDAHPGLPTGEESLETPGLPSGRVLIKLTQGGWDPAQHRQQGQRTKRFLEVASGWAATTAKQRKAHGKAS